MADQLREVITAAQLQQFIQAKVNAIEDVEKDKAKIKVPLPVRLDDEDGFGCNWTILSISDDGSYATSVISVIENFRSKYNL
jgi:hypothetical protein